jgi:hypothetical protein
METTLHRQLKTLYAGSESQCEVRVDSFRVDALQGERLIEVQHASLAALRSKLYRLLEAGHEVLVVKPIVHRKLIVRMDKRRKKELGRRYSPKRGGTLDIFSELVYLARLFPHPRLAIEVPLVEIEEWRCAARQRRFRGKAHTTIDQRLTGIVSSHRLTTRDDLLRFLPTGLPQPFHTADLAQHLDVARWLAQKMAYCLRTTGAVQIAGKQRNSWLYKRA